MVLADRAVENVRNGRRSRGPSPNGHSATVVIAGGVTESSSDDENSRKNGNSSKATKAKSEYEEKIRVGRDYQAVCPDMVPAPERKPEQVNDRALLVWSPTKEIPDSKLEEYITVAKEKYGYNGEQALGMLFWHKHDLERAVLDLANFTPFPDEWTVEDKVLFEQAFQFHGKSFHRIRQMLPDKSIASLVKFYYSWKKTRSRTSVMDRQEKMKKNDSSENGSDHGSNEDSDDDKPATALAASVSLASSTTHTAISGGPSATALAATNGTDSGEPGKPSSSASAAAATAEADSAGVDSGEVTGEAGGPVTNGNGVPSSAAPTSLNCSGCGVTCSELNATPQGNLCGSCYHHWRRTGVLRPTSGPTFMNKRARNSALLGKSGDSHKRRPPRGMYINHDDIVKLADSAQSGAGGAGAAIGTGTGVGSTPDTTNLSVDLLAGMDREIVSLWSQIQLNKQAVSKLKATIEDTSAVIHPAEVQVVRFTSRWNNEELLLAVQGVRKFGRNFQAIADTIGTKTEAQLRTFYVNYRRKYNLDSVLKDYEEEQKLLLQEQLNITNNNNSKEDDSTTSVSELESAADTNSIAGERLLELGKKPGEQDIMEIDLDDEMVNGKKAAETGEVGGTASTSALPTGSATGAGSTAAAATVPPAADGTAMEVDDPVPDASAKLSESSSSSTIVIK
ncbi:REST corepressor isoform X1 [Culex pipiens pallens]|uniref:REST corepressor isoform X1 n=1 Tax=Culex pipiens pallens TaxID=42434 RepID=UPI001952F124|nr:REST corepressor isoform X1 [Culex pipiens pallens]XP_039447287.1 REST corepressor isoform X1 [Culex pipiens pallens]XP_039447288.1 REST corepressor isoform X1 [Culex pipiens pallens]XP_052565289.1 REST corepressor isoform X1 [Culex pipiens pallens]